MKLESAQALIEGLRSGEDLETLKRISVVDRISRSTGKTLERCRELLEEFNWDEELATKELHLRVEVKPTSAEDADSHLHSYTRAELIAEVQKLRSGIRQHRDASGHNLCWYVPELWGLLPETVEVKREVPSTEEFLTCCRQYRKSLEGK